MLIVINFNYFIVTYSYCNLWQVEFMSIVTYVKHIMLSVSMAFVFMANETR